MAKNNLEDLRELVTSNLEEFWDFPKEGILFRDMSGILANADAFRALIDGLADHYRGDIDAVCGLESRGFILAAPLATKLGIPLVIVRKAGRLPGPVIGVEYALEYGSAKMEIRPDTVTDGHRVLIVDDVLATGGTAAASAQLIERSGATVEAFAMLMELSELGGRDKLPGYRVDSVCVF